MITNFFSSNKGPGEDDGKKDEHNNELDLMNANSSVSFKDELKDI